MAGCVGCSNYTQAAEEPKKKRFPYYVSFIEYYLRAVICGKETQRGEDIKEKIRIWLCDLSLDDYSFLASIFSEEYRTVKEAMEARGESGQKWAKLHMMEEACIQYLDV